MNHVKKIKEYLVGIQAFEDYSAFDFLLEDCINERLKRNLESFGVSRTAIHIDWLDDYKCINVTGRVGKGYFDLQIEPESFFVACDKDEPDDQKGYPLLTSKALYSKVDQFLKYWDSSPITTEAVKNSDNEYAIIHRDLSGTNPEEAKERNSDFASLYAKDNSSTKIMYCLLETYPWSPINVVLTQEQLDIISKNKDSKSVVLSGDISYTLAESKGYDNDTCVSLYLSRRASPFGFSGCSWVQLPFARFLEAVIDTVSVDSLQIHSGSSVFVLSRNDLYELRDTAKRLEAERKE